MVWALFVVLIDVSGSVCSCFVVRFNIVCGAFLHGLWCGLAVSERGFLCCFARVFDVGQRVVCDVVDRTSSGQRLPGFLRLGCGVVSGFGFTMMGKEKRGRDCFWFSGFFSR